MLTWLRPQLLALFEACNPRIVLSWDANVVKAPVAGPSCPGMLTWLRPQLLAPFEACNPRILLSWGANVVKAPAAGPISSFGSWLLAGQGANGIRAQTLAPIGRLQLRILLS